VVAEENAAPWTLACDPADVAACTASICFSMSRGAWADPTLTTLVAPPVTVIVHTVRAAEAVALLRQPGRHRARGGRFEPPGRVAAEVPRWRDLDRALAQVW
jgi:hypothetical protein